MLIFSKIVKHEESRIEIQKTKNKEICQEERKGNFFKDKVLSKVFHADLVGALNIMRIEIKSLKLNFYENLKVLFIKLCNSVRMKLIDFLYKVSPEPLLIEEIRSSRQELSSSNHFYQDKINSSIQSI